ncbi:MAG: hypothetical protein HFG65_16810 [Hungatella sp.]|nr:hypothetical protein [Hungatella sp.]
MDKQMQMIEEYKMLRSELMYFMNKDTMLLTCLFSAITATLFFSVEKNVQEGCLLAFLIIIPICNKFAYHQKQMAKISTYMVCFLEKELDIKWETRVEKIAQMKKNHVIDKKIHSISILKFSDCVMMSLATFLCYVFLLWKQCSICFSFRPVYIIWVETVLILILLIVTLNIAGKIYQIQKYREKYKKKWEQIDQEERRE